MKKAMLISSVVACILLLNFFLPLTQGYNDKNIYKFPNPTKDLYECGR